MTTATPRQRAFIARLLSERDGIPDVVPLKARLAQLAGDLTKTQASAAIEALLAVARPVVEAGAPKTITVEPGYYYADETVFKVKRSASTGRVYALRYEGATGRYGYAPGKVYDLEPDMELTLEEAKALGNLWDRCCICGTSLSATDSVAAGIGPVCIKRVRSRLAVAA